VAVEKTLSEHGHILPASNYNFQLVILPMILGHSHPMRAQAFKEQDPEADHRRARALELMSGSDRMLLVDITPPTCGKTFTHSLAQ